MSTTTERREHHERITKDALQQLHDGLAKLVESDAWRDMLRAAATFHTYSPSNYLLIWTQALARGASPRMPVAGFRQWKKLERSVRKGEHAYRVYAPRIKWVTDEETGERAQRLIGWLLVPVFTLDQTDGEPLPVMEPVMPEGEGPEGAWDALVSLATADGWKLTHEPSLFGEQGYTDTDNQRINITPGLSGAMACKTLAHEIAHRRLHDELGGAYAQRDVRSKAEIEAESTAFVVMTALGLDVEDYSLQYVAGWAKGDLDKVHDTIKAVLEAAYGILDDLDFGSVSVAA